MRTPAHAAFALAASLIAAMPAMAQAQQDPHHPAGSAPTQQAPGAPAAPTTPASGMPMTGMMMQMMRHGSTSMSEGPMPGMHMAERIEGRLAFLKTELKITDAQAAVWNEFAAAMRANAKKLEETRRAAMADASGGASSTPAKQLDRQERWYAARLEGIRAVKATVERLYPALSENQRETADELLGHHLGLMPMERMPMSAMQDGGMPMGMPMRGGRP